jgi:hypothetical protein
MRAWWRANRWFVIALAVLLPGAVLVSMIPRWFPYLERQPVPEAVALGDTVRYGGADITLTRLEVLRGDEWDAPAGADVVVATLRIDVVEPTESTRCDLELVSGEHGFERKWDAELYSDSDYRIPDDVSDRCTFAEPGSYELQQTFLVPAGQVREPVVQLTSSAALPRVS